MLSCHGGEIFLHVLNSTRSTLEDPPSISEGCGGRVTDYRITVCTERERHTWWWWWWWSMAEFEEAAVSLPDPHKPELWLCLFCRTSGSS